MSRRSDGDRPLLEACEGAEADDRSAVESAFMRIWWQAPQRTVTDLHVKEFCMLVFSLDKSGSGAQLSYSQITKRLLCTDATAKAAVRRAAREYGIIEVIEGRYQNGGQTANRYSINWPAVRSINRGLIGRNEIARSTTEADSRQNRSPHEPPVVTRQPPVVTPQGAAVTPQAPVVTRQPFKDNSGINSCISSSTHSLTPVDRAKASAEPDSAGDPDPWAVVSECLVSKGMKAPELAITAAQRRELSVPDVEELVERWERLSARQPHVTIAWLFRWMTGASEPPDEQENERASPPRAGLSDARTKANCIRDRAVKDFRKARGRMPDPGDRLLLAVIARRLLDSGLGDEMTDIEAASAAKLRRACDAAHADNS